MRTAIYPITIRVPIDLGDWVREYAATNQLSQNQAYTVLLQLARQHQEQPQDATETN